MHRKSSSSERRDLASSPTLQVSATLSHTFTPKVFTDPQETSPNPLTFSTQNLQGLQQLSPKWMSSPGCLQIRVRLWTKAKICSYCGQRPNLGRSERNVDSAWRGWRVFQPPNAARRAPLWAERWDLKPHCRLIESEFISLTSTSEGLGAPSCVRCMSFSNLHSANLEEMVIQ